MQRFTVHTNSQKKNYRATAVFAKFYTGRAQRFQELNVEANSYQTQIVTVYWTKLFRKWDRDLLYYYLDEFGVQ
jgi:hypothetical protein